VTLRLLWQEYRQTHPEGYGYSRFCELYERWAATLDPVLRQVSSSGGERCLSIGRTNDPDLHRNRWTIASASLFVAVLGASNKTYGRSVSESKTGLLDCRSCPRLRIFRWREQNHRSGQYQNRRDQKPAAMKPLLHASYQEMAQHYGTVIIPARPRRPKDKAKAEAAVLIAERQILAALRDQKFFHLDALNLALRTKVTELNAQPFQKLAGSRDSWFKRRKNQRCCFAG